MGLYAEFLTVLDTKTYVVTPRRGGPGGGEGKRRRRGGLLTERKHIVFTAHSSAREWPCSADWLVTEAFSIDPSSPPDTGGPLWSHSCRLRVCKRPTTVETLF